MHPISIETDGGVLVRTAGDGPLSVWLIHGYGDSGWSFVPLFDTPLARDFRLMVPDLPGFGASPPAPGRASIDGMADVVVGLIERLSPAGPIGLVGHSLGSPIAVRAAERLAPRVAALFSVEGNLTEADIFFSSRAVDFEDPEAFKQDSTSMIWRLAATRPELRRYHGSLAFADAETLWRLGRDSVPASRKQAFGAAYRSLACPTFYYWSGSNTPEVTQHYLRDHRIRHQQYQASHWPMVEIADQTAAAMGDFFRASLARGA